MICTAASHQGAIKEPAASLFRMCESYLVMAKFFFRSFLRTKKLEIPLQANIQMPSNIAESDVVMNI